MSALGLSEGCVSRKSSALPWNKWCANWPFSLQWLILVLLAADYATSRSITIDQSLKVDANSNIYHFSRSGGFPQSVLSAVTRLAPIVRASEVVGAEEDATEDQWRSRSRIEETLNSSAAGKEKTESARKEKQEARQHRQEKVSLDENGKEKEVPGLGEDGDKGTSGKKRRRNQVEAVVILAKTAAAVTRTGGYNADNDAVDETSEKEYRGGIPRQTDKPATRSVLRRRRDTDDNEETSREAENRENREKRAQQGKAEAEAGQGLEKLEGARREAQVVKLASPPGESLLEKWKREAAAVQQRLHREPDKEGFFRGLSASEKNDILSGGPKFTEEDLLAALKEILSARERTAANTPASSNQTASEASGFGDLVQGGLTSVELSGRQLEIVKCAQQLATERERESLMGNMLQCIRGLSVINCMRIFVWPILLNNLPESIRENLASSLPVEINLIDLFQRGESRRDNDSRSARRGSASDAAVLLPLLGNTLRNAIPGSVIGAGPGQPAPNTVGSSADLKIEPLQRALSREQLDALQIIEESLPTSQLRRQFRDRMLSCVERVEYSACLERYLPNLPFGEPTRGSRQTGPGTQPHREGLPRASAALLHASQQAPQQDSHQGEPGPPRQEGEGRATATPLKDRRSHRRWLTGPLYENPVPGESAGSTAYVPLIILPNGLHVLPPARQSLPAPYHREELFRKSVPCVLLQPSNYLTCAPYSTWDIARQSNTSTTTTWIPDFGSLLDYLPSIAQISGAFASIPAYVPSIPDFSSLIPTTIPAISNPPAKTGAEAENASGGKTNSLEKNALSGTRTTADIDGASLSQEYEEILLRHLLAARSSLEKGTPAGMSLSTSSLIAGNLLFFRSLTPKQLDILTLAEDILPAAARPSFVAELLPCLQGSSFRDCSRRVLWPFVLPYVPALAQLPNGLPDQSQRRQQQQQQQQRQQRPAASTADADAGNQERTSVPEKLMESAASILPVISITGTRFVPIYTEHPETVIFNILRSVQSTLPPNQASGSILNGTDTAGSNASSFHGEKEGPLLNEQQLNILLLAETLLPTDKRTNLVKDMSSCAGKKNFLFCSRDILWPMLLQYFPDLPSWPNFGILNQATEIPAHQPAVSSLAGAEGVASTTPPTEIAAKIAAKIATEASGGTGATNSRAPEPATVGSESSAKPSDDLARENSTEGQQADRKGLPLAETNVETTVERNGDATITITDTRFFPIFNEHPESVLINILRAVEISMPHVPPHSVSSTKEKMQELSKYLTQQQSYIVQLAESLLPGQLRQLFLERMLHCLPEGAFLNCMRDIAWPTLAQFFPRLPNFPNFPNLMSSGHSLPRSTHQTGQLDGYPSELKGTGGQRRVQWDSAGNGEEHLELECRIETILREALPEGGRTAASDQAGARAAPKPEASAPRLPGTGLTARQLRILDLIESGIPEEARPEYLNNMFDCLAGGNFLGCTEQVGWPALRQILGGGLPNFPSSFPSGFQDIFSQIPALPGSPTFGQFPSLPGLGGSLGFPFQEIPSPPGGGLPQFPPEIPQFPQVPQIPQFPQVPQVPQVPQFPAGLPIQVPDGLPQIPTGGIPQFIGLPRSDQPTAPLAVKSSDPGADSAAGGDLGSRSATTPSVGPAEVVPAYAGQPAAIFSDLSFEKVESLPSAPAAPAAPAGVQTLATLLPRTDCDHRDSRHLFDSPLGARRDRAVERTGRNQRDIHPYAIHPAAWEGSNTPTVGNLPASMTEQAWLQLLSNITKTMKDHPGPNDEEDNPHSSFSSADFAAGSQTSMSDVQVKIFSLLERISSKGSTDRGFLSRVLQCIRSLSFLRCMAIFVWPMISSNFPSLLPTLPTLPTLPVSSLTGTLLPFGRRSIDDQENRPSSPHHSLFFSSSSSSSGAAFQRGLLSLQEKLSSASPTGGPPSSARGSASLPLRTARGTKIKDNKNLPSILTIISDIMEEVLDQRPDSERVRKEKEKEREKDSKVTAQVRAPSRDRRREQRSLEQFYLAGMKVRSIGHSMSPEERVLLSRKLTDSLLLSLARGMKTKMVKIMPGIGLLLSFIIQMALAHARTAASVAGMMSNMALSSAVISMMRDTLFGGSSHPKIKYVYDNEGTVAPWPGQPYAPYYHRT